METLIFVCWQLLLTLLVSLISHGTAKAFIIKDSRRCLILPEPGSCEIEVVKWAYSCEMNVCMKITHGSCDDNDQRNPTGYFTEQECEAACVREDVWCNTIPNDKRPKGSRYLGGLTRSFVYNVEEPEKNINSQTFREPDGPRRKVFRLSKKHQSFVDRNSQSEYSIHSNTMTTTPRTMAPEKLEKVGYFHTTTESSVEDDTTIESSSYEDDTPTASPVQDNTTRFPYHVTTSTTIPMRNIVTGTTTDRSSILSLQTTTMRNISKRKLKKYSSKSWLYGWHSNRKGLNELSSFSSSSSEEEEGSDNGSFEMEFDDSQNVEL